MWNTKVDTALNILKCVCVKFCIKRLYNNSVENYLKKWTFSLFSASLTFK